VEWLKVKALSSSPSTAKQTNKQKNNGVFCSTPSMQVYGLLPQFCAKSSDFVRVHSIFWLYLFPWHVTFTDREGNNTLGLFHQENNTRVGGMVQVVEHLLGNQKALSSELEKRLVQEELT
jgi:hypothetical protein